MFNTMKRTVRQTSARTLADLIRAMDGKRAVTITYIGGDGEESVRTIEIHDIRTTSKGRIIVRAMCRMRGEMRTFHPAQIVAYTIHRMRFVLDTPASETRFTHAAETEAELISLELDRDYPDLKPLVLAA
ncbi:WYL domain-containing protein [Streptomyces sp. V1I6]|uniref:WYL domain-containing protein n=1 Tax=Streptomyces sp. V1I6 TaxID=3042273 RepID=UPI00278293CE|nr:WYL domain-containing protein [Streptomyces sp. V1I6]MDQ0847763.1 putative DNA-binding transcriptional regulator YafY [Streptomyces sp. V1I6]